MKRFDEEFNEQVVNAFSTYNADQLVDAGWNAFAAKHSKPKGLLVALPFWAKAASIVILLALGGALTFNLSNKEFEAEVASQVETPQVNSPKLFTPKELNITPSVVNTPAPASRSIGRKRAANTSNIVTPVANEGITIAGAELAVTHVDETPLPQITQMGNSLLTDSITHVSLDETEKVKTKPIIDPYIAAANVLYVTPETEVKRRRLSLSAGLSGIIASIKDMISDSPGVSLGLYAEHRLSNNISIRPGLALAKHSYGFQEMPSGNKDMMYDSNLPALDGVLANAEPVQNHMDIVAMEIPINFVFKVSERRKSKLFVSAGASTMVYLNQQFSGTLNSHYTNRVLNDTSEDWTYETNSARYQVVSQYDAFSRVDLFGLLNLSAGYVFPFSKSTSMTIEPFVQLPISSVTSSNLRIGFGGVSVKIQLNN